MVVKSNGFCPNTMYEAVMSVKNKECEELLQRFCTPYGYLCVV